MRKYYDFNEDYERGYEDGRRDYLSENTEIIDELLQSLQVFARNGLTIESNKDAVKLSSDYLRIIIEISNNYITVKLSTSHDISKKGINAPKTSEEFAIFGRQLSNVNKIYSVCKQIAKTANKGIHFIGL